MEFPLPGINSLMETEEWERLLRISNGPLVPGMMYYHRTEQIPVVLIENNIVRIFCNDSSASHQGLYPVMTLGKSL